MAKFSVTPGIFKKLFKTNLVAVVVAAIVLLGGSAAAYIGYVRPNQPENKLKRAAAKSLSDNSQFKINGLARVENLKAQSGELKAFDLNFNLNWGDQGKTSLFFEGNVAGIKLPTEIRLVENNLFIKIGDLSGVIAAAKLTSTQYVSLLEQINTSVANRWIEIDQNFLKQYGADCYISFNTKENLDYIKESLRTSNFAEVKSAKTEQLNGKETVKYTLAINEDKAKEFNNKLSGLPSQNQCSDSNKDNDYADKQIEKFLDKPNNEFYVWIDKTQNTISQIQLISSDDRQKVSVTMGLEYGNVQIEKPTDAKPLLEVLGNLAPLLQQGNLQL